MPCAQLRNVDNICFEQIERTVDQFQSLRTDLLRENKHLDINPFIAEDVSRDSSQLQTAFTSLLDDVGDQAWNHNSLIKFLDNAPSQSIIVNLKVNYLSDQVNRLALFICFPSGLI